MEIILLLSSENPHIAQAHSWTILPSKPDGYKALKSKSCNSYTVFWNQEAILKSPKPSNIP